MSHTQTPIRIYEASITILGRLARHLAKTGVKLKLFTSTIDAMPLIQETIKNAYQMEGKPEDYSDDFIELIANQSSLVSRYLGSLQREHSNNLWEKPIITYHDAHLCLSYIIN